MSLAFCFPWHYQRVCPLSQRFGLGTDEEALRRVHLALAAEAVNGVRGVRNQKNIGPKEQLNLLIKADTFPCIPLVEKMAGVKVELTKDFGDAQCVGFMVRTTELAVNAEEELAKAIKDLEYQQKFLQTTRAKLANEKFTAHAPAQVIENERKKEADALSKIESLQAKIAQLKK